MYAKSVGEQTTKRSLKTAEKTAEVLLDAVGHVLPKFDIYQSEIAQNCFKSHTNSRSLDFFQNNFCLMFDLKFTLSIVSTGQSLLVLKKAFIQTCFGALFSKYHKSIRKIHIAQHYLLPMIKKLQKGSGNIVVFSKLRDRSVLGF